MKNWTTDKLIETLCWIKDRRDYCRACNKPVPCQDAQCEEAVCAELEQRGFFRDGGGV